MIIIIIIIINIVDNNNNIIIIIVIIISSSSSSGSSSSSSSSSVREGLSPHGAGRQLQGRVPREVVSIATTPSPPIKSLDFIGFDSSELLILRGGNSHVHRI